ncbi:MAG: hypothetical protein HC930_14030 [Hydrococcus sp. SU_1_0]|nr:hypothetical protein [Hydrococcus sp. SU_1_0]
MIEEVSPQKVGKTVYVTGKVVHLAPFIDNGAYQMEDGTGKVWVVSTQTLPQGNQQIKIKGKIEYQSLPFAQQELGDFYLVELERLSLFHKFKAYRYLYIYEFQENFFYAFCSPNSVNFRSSGDHLSRR